jgi:hypothetical protein
MARSSALNALRAREARRAARPPGEEIGHRERARVLAKKCVIVPLERRLPEDVKKCHGTGPAPMRTHQSLDFRSFHGHPLCRTDRGRREPSPLRCRYRLAFGSLVATREGGPS